MKRLLIPLLFLAAAIPVKADINHSMQNIVSVSTLGASSTAQRIGSSLTFTGTNVTPTANTVSGAIGTLDLADNGISHGVPTVSYDTSYAVTNTGDSWAVSESYLQADTIPTSFLGTTVTSGKVPALPIFGNTTTVSGGEIGSTAMTMDSGGAMTVNLTSAGAGVTAQMSTTISLDID